MKRTRLRSRPKAHKTDQQLAHEWWVAIARGKRCVMCKSKRRVEAHHVVSKDVITRMFSRGAVFDDGRWHRCGTYDLRQFTYGEDYRSLEQLRWDKRNGIPLCVSCHARQENASERVPLSKIPAETFVFAQELGLEHRLSQRYYAAA